MMANKANPHFSVKPVNDLCEVRKVHLHSADLFSSSAPAQVERQRWVPCLPDLLDSDDLYLCEVPKRALPLSEPHQEELSKLLPSVFEQKYVEVRPKLGTETPQGRELRSKSHPLRIGLILSGGPAPGGHNVISGVYDYIKQKHPESQLFGMLGGLDGLLMNRYTVVNDEIMNRFRNMGGFDMLWSGRGRVNGDEDKETALANCEALELHGLVLVGGDGSNSNAALLADFFGSRNSNCSVVGVPKTIDGDLKNDFVEASFGFDTCVKTYSELIGNLCTDVSSAQSVYHFTRVMGRSASHLVLECALQTRPNLVFIGEEVERNNTTLQRIVDAIVDMILRRKVMGKSYGVILVPEGLIEFIPEMKKLITDMSYVLGECVKNGKHDSFDSAQLPSDSKNVWDLLPEITQEQLLSDRESTGYIQVAKVATERLLIMLTENELAKRNVDHSYIFMPHYFGYEGRCAMPSNFDATYCYTLGYTSGILIDGYKNGCMTIVKNLDQHSSFWTPGGVPFTHMMEIKSLPPAKPFPAVTRSLVDLKGPLFKVFSEVRKMWMTDDVYRCPGPIQFEGDTCDMSHYSLQIPNKEELLWGMVEPIRNHQVERAMCPKRLGCFGPLQKERLLYRPKLPALCVDLKARAVTTTQILPKDPYTRRQILTHYPYMSNHNHFTRVDVEHDKYTAPINAGLRIGLVFLSRQSPGVINVLWGLYERLFLVGGSCIGFYGLDGLVQGKAIEGVNFNDLELFINQGGVDLLGRYTRHSLVHENKRDQAMSVCKKFQLDGLILVGSAFAMTEAAMLSEHFLRKQCSTSVVGIPATGSNNIGHELIETCIGFDSSTKVYASLVGNILTDAASMPKYWHFIRLMGRQPSHEVLECALQTHPNVVIIAEEYGAANKTLAHVVEDIADTVCLRAQFGKNFGTVLIPDALLLHLPNMKILLMELGTILKEAQKANELKTAQQAMIHLEDNADNKYVQKVLPWSAALFKTFPKFIRREMLQVDSIGELRFTTIETEEILASMVKEELATRKADGRYKGKFQSVTHFFGYQGRSSLPSLFDSTLAFVHGHLASILIESGLTGYCTTVRGLCGDVENWKLVGVPLLCLLQIVPNIRDTHYDWGGSKNDMPVVPSAELSLHGRAFRWMKTALEQWALQDHFCNPGPIQFHGTPSTYYNRVLHEEQSEYYEMLRLVQCYTSMLDEVCRFGVGEEFLKSAFVSLTGLLTLASHPDDLSTQLPALVDVDQYTSQSHMTQGRPHFQHSNLSNVLAKNNFDKLIQGSNQITHSISSVAHPNISTTAGYPRKCTPPNISSTINRSITSLKDAAYSSFFQRKQAPKFSNHACPSRRDGNVQKQETLIDSQFIQRNRLSLKNIEERLPQIIRSFSKDNESMPTVDQSPYAADNISIMLEQKRI